MGTLITADELSAALGRGVRILDVRRTGGGRAAFEAGHLPGSVYVDLDAELSAPGPDPAVGGRHPLPDVADFARRVGQVWGIAPETEVVLVDDARGALAAARAWWMLRALGHEGVAVLDGGLAAARDGGLPLETGPGADPPPAPPYPVPAGGWARPTVTLEEVDALRRAPDRKLLDARSAARFRGDDEPLDPIPGHIGGAVSAPYETTNLDPETGRFLPPAELARRYTGLLAGVPAGQAVAQCGSGVTACHTLLAMEHAGLPGAALYVGSWSEWCRRFGDQAPTR